MLSINRIAVATMVQATSAEAPAKAISWVSGRRRMNRVSLSDLRKTRLSGKRRSRNA
jgi:hypothetical protein